jgi:hypothetical protein
MSDLITPDDHAALLEPSTRTLPLAGSGLVPTADVLPTHAGGKAQPACYGSNAMTMIDERMLAPLGLAPHEKEPDADA